MVRLFRPFSAERLGAAIPRTGRVIGMLDRPRTGEPLYLDVLASVSQAWDGTLPRDVGGRYGSARRSSFPA